MLRPGLIDYLESLRSAGVEDWGPFDPERLDKMLPASEPHVQEIAPHVLPAEYREESMARHPHPSPVVSVAERQTALDLVASEVARCKRCAELASTRTQTVFGTGNPMAKLVFLGEAPGAEEDKQGVPFVGRAGQLLTDILEKGMGLTRGDVYICNILRCRPPGNRNPTPDEAARCREYLDRTLEIIAPMYICCLGAVAAQNLLQTDTPIGRLRGAIHSLGETRVICTYHPAYLLRNPAAKQETWKDIQILMKLMGLTRPASH